MHGSVVLISGGLGNQLFEYCFYLYLRKRFPDVRFVMNASYYKRYSKHTGFELDNLFDIGEDQMDRRDLYTLPHLCARGIRPLYRFLLKRGVYFDETCSDMSRPAGYYDGYWVSCRYYEQVRDEFNASFKASVLAGVHDLDIYRRIVDCNSCFIHVRRGDYVGHGKYLDLSSTDYYRNAVNHVLERRNDISWFIFSDDIPWCREHMGELVKDATFVEYPSQNPICDMLLMAGCTVGGIIANSTFSWWGGLLGKDDRMLLVPDRYYTHETVDYDYPSSWVRIATGWQPV